MDQVDGKHRGSWRRRGAGSWLRLPTLHWRRYHTFSGGDPEEFRWTLPADDSRALADALRHMRETGMRGGRHLRGDLYEVRARTGQAHYRLIFSQESRSLLLVYDKNTEKTPRHVEDLVQRRLADWMPRINRAHHTSRSADHQRFVTAREPRHRNVGGHTGPGRVAGPVRRALCGDPVGRGGVRDSRHRYLRPA